MLEWIAGGVLGAVAAALALGVLLWREGSKRKKAEGSVALLTRELTAERHSSAGLRRVVAEKDRELEALRPLVPADQLFDSVFGGVSKAGPGAGDAE